MKKLITISIGYFILNCIFVDLANAKAVNSHNLTLNSSAGRCDPFINHKINFKLKNKSCRLQEIINIETKTFEISFSDRSNLILEKEDRLYSCKNKNISLTISWRHRVLKPESNNGNWGFLCRVDSIVYNK